MFWFSQKDFYFSRLEFCSLVFRGVSRCREYGSGIQIDDTRKSIRNIVKIWTSGIENRDALTDSRQREAFRSINYWEI
jgi:hypothetical protein